MLKLSINEKLELVEMLEQKLRLLCTQSLREFCEHAWPTVEPGSKFIGGWHIDAICEHLEALADGSIKNLLINIPPRHAKPCYLGSMVLEKYKGRIKLSEVKRGDYVLTHKGRFRKVLKVHEQGVLPLLEIKTHSGRSVRLNDEHPLLTARGWIKAKDINENDCLAEVHGVEECGTDTITPEEARLIGYLVGDGSIKSLRVSFTNCTPEVLEDFKYCAELLGFTTEQKKIPPSNLNKMPKASYIVLKPKYPENVKTWQNIKKLGPHPVWSWLEKHGLKGKCSYDKRVPKAVMSGSLDIIKNYLAAYWSCDGSISNRSTKFIKTGRIIDTTRSDVRCTATTVCEELAYDHQHLITRLGIRARVRKRYTQIKTRIQGDLYYHYSVEICSQDGIGKFVSVIPLKGYKAINGKSHIRSDFDRILHADRVVSITRVDPDKCRCLTVKEDSSFTLEDIAVHNSTLVSIMFPAWMWLRKPSHKFIYASHSYSLAKRDSIKCRLLITSQWYRNTFNPKWALAEDQNEKLKYDNTVSGSRLATSVGSSVIGLGGDTLAIDDPHAPTEVRSDNMRSKVIDWFDMEFSSRVNDPKTASKVVIMQRLHQMDLSQHLLDKKDWEHLCLPAQFEGVKKITSIGWSDPRTDIGEPLWPGRFGTKEIEEFKRNMGSMTAAGQLQQRPAPAEGAIFKRGWFKYYKQLPAKFDQIIQAWDFAVKDKTTSDYTVGIVIGRIGSEKYVLDMIRDRMNFPTACQALINLSRKWPQTYKKVIEAKAAGPSIIQTLNKQIPGLIEIEPDGDKVARANAISPDVEAGNVYLPDASIANWVHDFLEELCIFPAGRYDDAVDAFVYGINELRKASTLFQPISGHGIGLVY